jgi:RNA polymerase sigma-70 factor (ECF subfamily)
MTSESVKRDYFLQLLSASENRLRAFILGALAAADDRADLFQDVVLILWRKFEHYDNRRPFLPWAMGIAVLRMKEEYRRSARRPCLLEDDHLERLAHALESGAPDAPVSAEEEALADCLASLPSRSAALIQRRYYDHLSIEALSQENGQSAAAIYQSLSRLRRGLADCIRQRLLANATDFPPPGAKPRPAIHSALIPPL